MDSVLPQTQLEAGPIFLRELQGNTLVLVPHRPLGSLNETEIVGEAGELVNLIQQQSPLNLVIDLQQGEYLGTALLGSIVRLWKRVALGGGRLALCNISEQVFQILRVTKLHTVWPIYGTRDEALAFVEGA
jgi:anti-sigma B factor antagonist